jgi:hypothetical protein
LQHRIGYMLFERTAVPKKPADLSLLTSPRCVTRIA